MKRAIALSVIDQGVLSAQSVLFGFLLIRMGDAEAVGRFALAMAAFFIFLAVQNALVGTPLMTRVFGRPPEVQANVLRVACTFDVYIIGGALLAGAIVLAAIGFTAVEVASAVAMIVAGLLRELSRTISISTGNMRMCLTVDATAVVISLGILWPLNTMVPAEIACLLSIAAGNLAAIAVWRPRLHIVARETLAVIGAYRPHFSLTRWSLLAAVSNELQARAFLFAIEIVRGIAATGIVQVGRLLVSPLSLMGMAWGRVALPRMSAHFSANAPGRAFAIMYASMACLSVLAIVYFAVIYFAWDWLDHFLFQNKYPGLAHIVLGWCAFTLVSEPVRALSWVFQASHRFRELALLVMADAVGVIVLMVILVLPVPLYSTLAILTLGQLVLAAALLWLMPARARLREAAV